MWTFLLPNNFPRCMTRHTGRECWSTNNPLSFFILHSRMKRWGLSYVPDYYRAILLYDNVKLTTTKTFLYTYIHIYTYTHIYIYTHIHTLFMYTYMYTYIHIYTYTYIHIYIYTHIQIYTYTYVIQFTPLRAFKWTITSLCIRALLSLTIHMYSFPHYFPNYEWILTMKPIWLSVANFSHVRSNVRIESILNLSWFFRRQLVTVSLCSLTKYIFVSFLRW